jgi:hypothetical protein
LVTQSVLGVLVVLQENVTALTQQVLEHVLPATQDKTVAVVMPIPLTEFVLVRLSATVPVVMARTVHVPIKPSLPVVQVVAAVAGPSGLLVQ